MAMTINTNVISINAQRNLGLSGSSLGTTMQRLSSGLRVNSAKDDAAGLAIAERMNSQVKGLTVAARNANDGISLAQTAEGALGKVGDMLQRMRELAVQSSNATNSADDRKALQAEVNQLRAEIDRVAKTTSFNGQKILDGSFAGGVFQVGSGAGDNITVGGITNAKATALSRAEYGSSTTNVKTSDITNLKAIDSGVLKIQVGTGAAIELGGLAEASSGQERLGQVVSAINAKTADTGVTAFLVEGKTQGEFAVELRSSGGESVALTGFKASTTGVGIATTTAFSSTNLAAYNAVITEIDTILAKTKVGTATADITVGNLTTLYTNVNALDAAATSALGGPEAKAMVASALTALNSAVSTEMLAVVGVAPAGGNAGTPAGAATTLDTTAGSGVATVWKTTANQYPVTSTAVAADTDKVKDALTALKTALGEALDAQQKTNLTPISNDYQSALDKTTAATFDTAVTALNTKLTAAGMQALAVPKLGTTGTAEQLQEAKELLVSSYNEQLNGGFGVSLSEVKVNVGIEKLDISTQAGAWEALSSIDSAIDQVNAARADLGALQTRFEKSIENIDIMKENIAAARGRIVDADFASETANLSRAQILQQAGTAMVAQANQLPQQVLSLLQ